MKMKYVFVDGSVSVPAVACDGKYIFCLDKHINDSLKIDS